jgi:hypothetical protein
MRGGRYGRYLLYGVSENNSSPGRKGHTGCGCLIRFFSHLRLGVCAETCRQLFRMSQGLAVGCYLNLGFFTTGGDLGFIGY